MLLPFCSASPKCKACILFKVNYALVRALSKIQRGSSFGLLFASDKIPTNITIGFSYLMAIYTSIFKGDDGKFYAKLPSGAVEYKDDIPYLEYFANGGSVEEFMKNVAVWGEDLTKYTDFLSSVENNLKTIKSGKNII